MWLHVNGHLIRLQSTLNEVQISAVVKLFFGLKIVWNDSFICLSHDRSKYSSKANSAQSGIHCFHIQYPVLLTFLHLPSIFVIPVKISKHVNLIHNHTAAQNHCRFPVLRYSFASVLLLPAQCTHIFRWVFLSINTLCKGQSTVKKRTIITESYLFPFVLVIFYDV